MDRAVVSIGWLSRLRDRFGAEVCHFPERALCVTLCMTLEWTLWVTLQAGAESLMPRSASILTSFRCPLWE